MVKLPRYHSLIAWRRADELFIRLHRVTREHFPPDERYELTSQLRRAAFSVPANIVEGTARHYPRETLQFLRTAWASLIEAVTASTSRGVSAISAKHSTTSWIRT